MAHLVETMAYAGELPWHGLGVRVNNDLTPRQMMEQAGLDWSVNKVDTYARVLSPRVGTPTVEVPTGRQALLRSTDNKVLTEVGPNWNPVQNEEAFDFFTKYCSAGDMEMHTAGSLDGGKMVWVLAKIKESFDVLGEDRVDNYLLFSNPHVYGKCLNVRMTPVRVVCNNTLTMSLSAKSKNEVSLNHRSTFDPAQVEQQLGIAHEKFEMYKDMAQFLSRKRFTAESMIEYYNNVFPHADGRKVLKLEDLSGRAKTAHSVLETQPGAQYGEGSFWQLLNSVTYATDHILGRNNDTRLQNAWYGYTRGRKVVAVNDAVRLAEVA